MRYQRSLGIIKDDALLAIQPARTFIHFGNDRVEPKRQNPVSQNSLCRIEIFSLPRKMIYEVGHVICIGASRSNDRGTFVLAAWDFAGCTLSDQTVHLR